MQRRILACGSIFTAALFMFASLSRSYTPRLAEVISAGYTRPAKPIRVPSEALLAERRTTEEILPSLPSLDN